MPAEKKTRGQEDYDYEQRRRRFEHVCRYAGWDDEASRPLTAWARAWAGLQAAGSRRGRRSQRYGGRGLGARRGAPALQ